MATINDLRTAVENKTAQVLTVDLAKKLQGKKIATIYFGYKGQDGFDEFTIGEVVSELDLARKEVDFKNIDPRFNNRAEYWESYMTENQLSERRNTMVLLTSDNRNTYIRSYKFNNGDFTCSDSDRFVFFIEITSQRTEKICGINVKITEDDFCPSHFKQEFKDIEDAILYMKRKDVRYKPIKMGEKMLTLEIFHTDEAIDNLYENEMSISGKKLPTKMWK